MLLSAKRGDEADPRAAVPREEPGVVKSAKVTLPVGAAAETLIPATVAVRE
jgi:hypothetical protein